MDIRIIETNVLYVFIVLSILITSCKSNKFAINSSEVKSVHFWFVGDIESPIPIEDCAEIVYMQDNHDTIITDRKVIERYVSIINRTKPIDPKLYYDLRVSSLIRMKLMNGEKKPDIKVCIGDFDGRILIDGVLMKGSDKKFWKFIQEILYDPLTPYDWLPEIIKGYLKDHPEERSDFLPDE